MLAAWVGAELGDGDIQFEFPGTVFGNSQQLLIERSAFMPFDDTDIHHGG